MLEQQSYLNINTAPQEQEFTVSQVSEALKRTLEEKFASVRVRGEVSGLKVATSGHMYLSLKDDKAVLGAACWAGIASRLPFKVEEGMEVVCTGKISAYAARSNYQLIIEKMEIAGVGALLAMLEKRRKLLEAEGLFALERKRKLPFLPTVIGVVTSPTGAVIKDILHRLSDRFPVHVVIWPVLVQGNGAAEQIAKAIEGFNSLPRNLPQPDVLIVARGGGSIEDLWAFNEEIVVRAAANSRIPLISAVGHETDTTLIDFASDRRAPTPTAAAEIAVPVREDLIVAIETYSGRMGSAITSKLKNSESMVLRLNAGLMRFTNNLQSLEHRISQIGIRLTYGLRRQLDQKVQRFELLLSKLSLKPFLQENEKKLMQLEALSQQLENSMVNILKHMETRVGNFSRLLDSFNYTKVLERGYTMIWGSDNKPVTRASQVQPEQEIQVEFADGRIKARKVS